MSMNKPDFQRGHQNQEISQSAGARSGCSDTLLYFAYGSNMNTNQMAFRCPDAEVVEAVRLNGYRLTFRTNGSGNGVATILPEPGSHVDGVLWQISRRDEQHLDHYEGFPHLYGKEPVTIMDQLGNRREVMAYTMNQPYRDVPAMPSVSYLEGILRGCRQNGIETRTVLKAVQRTQQELPTQEPLYKKHLHRKQGRDR